MADKLLLDPQAILEKEFDIDFKGYNPEQVDLLLDSVIKDYQTYQKMIRIRNQKIEDLEKTNASLRAKLIEVEGRMKAQEDAREQYGASSNVDVLKRLSRLEKQVFDTKNRK